MISSYESDRSLCPVGAVKPSCCTLFFLPFPHFRFTVSRATPCPYAGPAVPSLDRTHAGERAVLAKLAAADAQQQRLRPAG
jgi:hypothetical protein